jgi:S1-C subfamily serine protease
MQNRRHEVLELRTVDSKIVEGVLTLAQQEMECTTYMNDRVNALADDWKLLETASLSRFVSALKRMEKQKGDLQEFVRLSIAKHANAIPEIARELFPSVVMVEKPRWSTDRVTGERKIRWGGGTGFFYGNGIIVTAGHITLNLGSTGPDLPPARIKTYDGKAWEILDVVTCKDFDYYSYGSPDIGLIRISKEAKYPAVKLGSTMNLRPGQPIVVIGHPFMMRYSVSSGVVSRVGPGPMLENSVLLQIDARINGGNSGGPVLGLDGLCYGFCSFLYNPLGQEGLNYFIPEHTISKYLPEMIKVLEGKEL